MAVMGNRILIQGSTLGAFLFLTVMNDIPFYVRSDTIFYVDDTTVLSVDDDAASAQLHLNNYIKGLDV